MLASLRHLLTLGFGFLPRSTASGFSSKGCTNTPTTRSCWAHGYDITTDYYSHTPPGKLVEYDLVVSQKTISPNGYETVGMVVNGQYPGPTIEADWGDTIRVTVHNNLTNHNGTAMHWHGIRLDQVNWLDGAPGVTQCPVKPGDSQTYEFRATQYGTTWYHSHFSLQYSTGLYGPLVIRGPSSMNWDVDLGPWFLSDWYNGDVFILDHITETTDAVAAPDSTVLNGNGVFACDPGNDTRCSGRGEYYEVVFDQGTAYKFTLANTGTLLTYTLYIEGHNFTVIATDFVPIEPYITGVLNVGIGQRYEIVVQANETLTNGTNFWIHAQYCGLPGFMDSRVGIIRYNANDTSEPAATQSYVDYGCDDPVTGSLTPIVKQTVGSNVNRFNTDDYMYFGQGQFNLTWPGAGGSSWLWEMKRTPFNVNWSEPTVGQITGLSANTTAPNATAPVYLDYETGDWVYYVITGNFTPADVGLDPNLTLPATVHPMHLHGHDFVVLAQGYGPFVEAEITPLLENPTRRDTVNIPVGGWVWIAFQVGNPGAWLLHCHAAWHSSDGFAMQFIEQPRKLLGLMESAGVSAEFKRRCDAWSEYYENVNVPAHSVQQDSGI